MNRYAYCAECGFGIEVNGQETNISFSADFYFEQDGLTWCYHCYKSRTPRTIAQLKSLLAESEVLLASAKRVNDDKAIAFYSNQIERARQALRLKAPEPEPQGSLF